MKINFLISSLSGGGAEKVLTTLAKEFAVNGNDVAIISLEKRPQFYQIDENIKLIKIDNKGKGKIKENISDFKEIRKFLKTRKADISISFLSRCNLMTIIANTGLKNRVVVCDRNNPLREHSVKAFKLSCFIYQFATAISVQTEQIKSFYPKKLQDKIFVIENPLDMEALSKQLGDTHTDREKTIVSMGRLEPQKDFKTLIEAYSEIASKYSDWKLKIYGIGDMKDELQMLIDSKNMSDKIMLCGRTEKPYLALREAEIFVLSSNYEGFPNVLCEAMYAGCACISSDCVSGPRELIVNGENGLLFDVGDKTQLKSDIEKLINNENLRKSFSDKAYETTKRLSVNNIFTKWNNKVEELIKG